MEKAPPNNKEDRLMQEQDTINSRIQQMAKLAHSLEPDEHLRFMFIGQMTKKPGL
jgi:hypothetical protein